MLVTSLAAFLFAWAVGSAPYRKSGMIVADAMHRCGLFPLNRSGRADRERRLHPGRPGPWLASSRL